MATDARIAVTGIGVVGPGATGAGALRELLRGGTSAIGPVSRFDTSTFGSHSAALIEDFEPKRYIPPAKMRRMNQLSRFAVASAKLALDDARMTEIPDHDRGGVAIGTMFGPVETSVKYLDEYREKGPALAPPQLFAESVANAPGSHVAIQYGMRGFNLTFTQRESSAATALCYAALQLATGSASVALAGGVDEINEITFGVYDRIRALSRAEAGVEEAARPFDRARNGLVLGEGGAILLLMANPSDLPVYGWIAGFAQGRDQTAGLSDWGRDGEAVERVMRRALDDASIPPSRIGAVFASANGNRKCDQLEAAALSRLFGDSCPPVVGTKGVFGEYAAGGGLQLASALMAVRYGEIYPTVGFESLGDGIDLPVTTAVEDRELEFVLVNSLSAGGGILSVVIAHRDSER